MKAREEILRILAERKPELEGEFKVRSLALFGSYVRGDQGEASDIDVLVDVDPTIGLGFVALAERLEQLVGGSVDLVSRRAVSPRALKEIERELVYV